MTRTDNIRPHRVSPWHEAGRRIARGILERVALWRRGPVSERDRSRRVSRTFFFHFHASRIHPFSLRPGYTLGLGVVSAFLFLVLAVTGALLMVYYVPSVERAYSSTADIMFVVPAGRFVRNIHRWAAHAMVLTAVLHMCRVFYTGAYGAGRGINWLVGLLLLVLTLLLSFTGYLLPWDQLSYWAVTIGANIAASVSDLTAALGLDSLDPGRIVKLLLLGSQEVGQDALIRFYLLHIVLLPLLMAALIGLHFWRIRKDGGISRPLAAREALEDRPGTGRSRRDLILSWPTLFWAEVAVASLATAALLLAAYAMDAPLLGMADPTAPENPAKAPWYFLGIQELVSYSAFGGGILVPFLLGLALAIIPWIDREDRGLGIWFSDGDGRRTTLRSTIIGALGCGSVLAPAIALGYPRAWLRLMHPLLPILFNPATILAGVITGWALFVLRSTRSTRLAVLAFFTASVVAVVLVTAIGLWFRGPDWRFIFPGTSGAGPVH
jgi:quinol-cytochrome oxidoreductase complex cytochrome b subunit